jgi:hypothetical protein
MQLPAIVKKGKKKRDNIFLKKRPSQKIKKKEKEKLIDPQTCTQVTESNGVLFFYESIVN